jgi:DNA polymerase-1
MYSDRELELLNELTAICQANSLDIHINEVPDRALAGKPCSLDVEHDEAGNFVCCGLYFGNGGPVYSIFDIQLLRRIDFSAFSIIAHNGKGDLECLRMWGVPVSDAQLVWDTQLISHILDSSLKAYGLKALAERELAISYPSYDDIVGKKTKKQKAERRTLDKWPIEIVSRYNAFDCFVTWKLYDRVKNNTNFLWNREGKYFNELEKPVSFILRDMENRGICVDLDYLRELKTNLELQKSPLESQIKNELGNINLGSPKQLLEALQSKGLNPINYKGPSTDKEAISKLPDSPLKYNLQKYNELGTLLTTFVYCYLERNVEVVHCFFNQTGTRTGRLSCSNPNLQQIPIRGDNGKRVRRMFIPRDGMLFGKADYGQIDLRAMAHLSKDIDMCNLFNSGESIHKFTQRRMELGGILGEGPEYDKAKVFNLSVGYFATPASVSSQLKCSWEEAEKQIEIWWSLFPGLRRWGEKLTYDCTRSGFCTTLLGRRIKIDGLDSTEFYFDRKTGKKIFWKRESAKRQMMNNICQGTATEIIKKGMIKISENNGYSSGFGLLVQVHDDLLAESYDMIKDIKMMEFDMIKAIKLDVPLTVDCKIGPNWADCK